MGEKEQASSLGGGSESASSAASAVTGRPTSAGGDPGDQGAEPENVVKTKTKSNQSND